MSTKAIELICEGASWFLFFAGIALIVFAKNCNRKHKDEEEQP